MALTKQAKALSDKQVKNAISRMNDYRKKNRNTAIIELTLYAGLRAKEVAGLCWVHILDENKQISNEIRLTDDISKGKSGGIIPLHPKLRETLSLLLSEVNGDDILKKNVIRSSQGGGMKTQSVINFLFAHYKKCDIAGASSHSGRRTFITNAARKISSVGGSIRDVQQLARHSNLQTTQRYIETNSEAQKAVINLL
jgi:integrase/recombinase XerD